MGLIEKLTAIGNAVRAKTGKTAPLTLDAMAAEITALEAGGGGGETDPTLAALTSDGTDFSYLWYKGKDRRSTDIPLPMPDTSRGEKFAYTFYDCEAAQYPAVLDLSSATDTSYLFARSNTRIYMDTALSNMTFDLSQVEMADSMFERNNLAGLPTMRGMENIRSMKRFARGCRHFSTISLPDTVACENFSGAFDETEVTDAEINITSATDCTNMFNESYLERLRFHGKLKTSFLLYDCTYIDLDDCKRIMRDNLTDFAGTDEEWMHTIGWNSEIWMRLESEMDAPDGFGWRDHLYMLGWNT